MSASGQRQMLLPQGVTHRKEAWGEEQQLKTIRRTRGPEHVPLLSGSQVNQWDCGIPNSREYRDGQLACFVFSETRSHYAAIQAGLKLPATRLPEPPHCWDYKSESSWQTVFLVGLFVFAVLGTELQASITEPHPLDLLLEKQTNLKPWEESGQQFQRTVWKESKACSPARQPSGQRGQELL